MRLNGRMLAVFFLGACNSMDLSDREISSDTNGPSR